MSESLYTKDQIREAIWQELKESQHTGKDNDRAYETIGIVMAALDRVVLSQPPAAAGSGKDEAIAFAEWIKNEQWNQRSGIDWARYITMYSDISIKTTEQLYEIFKQNK